MPPQLAEALLADLRVRLRAPGLGYAEPPHRLGGGYGFDTEVFGLRLAGAPPGWEGPLVLRRFTDRACPAAVRVEAAVQGAVAAAGVPAAPVLAVETAPSAVGRAFMLMPRLPGRIMGGSLEAAGAAGVAVRPLAFGRDVVEIVTRAPRLMAEAQVRVHAVDPRGVERAVADAGGDTQRLRVDFWLASLAETVDAFALDGFTPVVDWLRARRPPPGCTVVCHGDLHPANLLAAGGALTGVVDWAHAALAEPEFDAAWARFALQIVPLDLPRALTPPVASLRCLLVRCYESECAARGERFDPARVRYYEVLACVWELATVARLWRGVSAPYMFNSPAGVRALTEYVRRRTGLAVTLPAPRYAYAG